MSKIKFTIGIDPGKFGAVAVMDIQQQQIISIWDCPIIKAEGKKASAKNDRFDLRGMWSILKSLKPIDEMFVVLEHAVSMPGQDSRTVMKAGYGYGIWEMGLACAGLSYRIIYPITWAKELFKDFTEANTKVSSYEVAKSNFPDAEFVTPGSKKKKPMDGRTDAMCIALYAARFIIATE